MFRIKKTKKSGKNPAAVNKLKENVAEEVAMPAERTSVADPSGPKTGAASSEPQLTLRYIDRIDCTETFADSINALSFDGQSLRIEFGVTRLDERKPNTPMTGRRYPACRLVLTPAAGVELINKMQQIGAALVQAGVAKAAPSATASREEPKAAST